MIYQGFLLLALLAFVYAALSGYLEKTPINGALVFTLFGLGVGAAGLDWFALEISGEGLQVIAEITLAVVLFSDAAKVNFGTLKKQLIYPERLLLIGLPLTILLGFVVGLLVFDELSIVALAILATILAPTDAALGKAVVSDENVKSSVRQTLNVESGLNDGICVPVLLAFVAVAVTSGGSEASLIHLMAREIGIGLACGLITTLLAVWLLRRSTLNHWISGSWMHLPVVSLALLCFCSAQLMGGSGFIAAFCGGLLFGGLSKAHKHELLEPAEAIGDSLSMATWVIFGAIAGPALKHITWEALLYAVLSLTVVRMAPVFLSLLGTSLTTGEKLFVGWFGPRGLASIVFGVMVASEGLPGGDTITITMICTVLLSVALHGITANPLVKAIAPGSGR